MSAPARAPSSIRRCHSGARTCANPESRRLRPLLIAGFRVPPRWGGPGMTAMLLRARRCLAREHGSDREQSLVAGPRSLVIVQEFEVAFLEFEYGYVRRRAHIEGAALVERGEYQRPAQRC